MEHRGPCYFSWREELLAEPPKTNHTHRESGLRDARHQKTSRASRFIEQHPPKSKPHLPQRDEPSGAAPRALHGARPLLGALALLGARDMDRPAGPWSPMLAWPSPNVSWAAVREFPGRAATRAASAFCCFTCRRRASTRAQARARCMHTSHTAHSAHKNA